MLHRWRHMSLIILLLVSMSTLSSLSLAAATPAPTSWPKLLENIKITPAGGAMLTSNGESTLINCEPSPLSTASMETFSPGAVTLYAPSGKIAGCMPRAAIGPSGIIYASSIESGGYKQYAAYHHGLTLWKTPPLCYAAWAAGYSVGPDGNLYVLEDATNSACSPASQSGLALSSYNGTTGQLRFP